SDPWLHYVDYRENISWDNSSSAREAEWLATLVPRTFYVTTQIARAWHDAGRNDRALEAFRELEEQLGEPFDRKDQDLYLAALRRPRSERIAHLEAGLHPLDVATAKKLIVLQIEDRRYAQAEARARSLLGQPSELRWGCWILVELAGLRGQADA